MEAIRVTLNSDRLAPIIDLPSNLCDREVEVIVLPISTVHPEKPDPEKAHTKRLFGNKVLENEWFGVSLFEEICENPCIFRKAPFPKNKNPLIFSA